MHRYGFVLFLHRIERQLAAEPCLASLGVVLDRVLDCQALYSCASAVMIQ